jgi:hypothetical protein
LATFGIGGRPQAAVWSALVVIELALGAGVLAGFDMAAYAAAALLAAFAAVLAWAVAGGRRGRPCGCLGSRSKVGGGAVVRNLAAAAVAASIPSIASSGLSDTTWLGIGLAVALAGLAALAVAIAALAREVGELRLRVAPQLALDIPGEGPAAGTPTNLVSRFTTTNETRLLVAVFSSEGCPMCVALEPSVGILSRDSLLAVEVFDEHADAAVWSELAIPGSPYGLVLDPTGTVLAKGTFNNLGQLQGLIAGAASQRSKSAAVTHA